MKHELNGILSTFDDVITRAKELGIKIEPPSNKLSVEGMCRKLIVHCDCIITTIEYSITPLSTKQKDNLDSFKKEVGQICRLLDYNFEVSINKSIQSLNEGDNLGSSLITAKILDYMLSQLASNNNIDGKNITDKIKTLVDEDIIDADKEIITKLIIKTDKKVRNALVHNISYHPDTAEALSLLGDCVSVMKIYAKVNSHFETQ
jgi:hypothetical protein